MGDIPITDRQIADRIASLADLQRRAVNTAEELLALTGGDGSIEHHVSESAIALLSPLCGGRARAGALVREARKREASMVTLWARMSIEWEVRDSWLKFDLKLPDGSMVSLEQDADGYDLMVSGTGGEYARTVMTREETLRLVNAFLDHEAKQGGQG